MNTFPRKPRPFSRIGKRRFAAIILGGSVAVSSLFLSSPAAQADPVPIGQAPCAENHLCFYKDKGFKHLLIQFPAMNVQCITLGVGTSNETTAIVNKTRLDWFVYDRGKCFADDKLGTIFARTANDKIGAANDQISSFGTAF
jgi:hypothetical protein